MNSNKSHGNQGTLSPKARNYRDQLTLITIVEELEHVADDLADGNTVKALHAVRELAGWLLDAMRESLADHASLPDRPVHQIDSSLHSVRRSVLEKRAKAEGWRFRWEGEAFTAETDLGFLLFVDPADNWRMAANGPDIQAADCGLTSLLFALNGSTFAEEASRLSRWIDRTEGKRNA